eukprot:NODE_43_length_28809_cov_0.237200.p11 type:complete len:328 gc:universal NODE_43_length_28809_cov_0.237200:4037-3054(-)
MKRILSGLQPSGILHIGNYLGSIKSWVQMQNIDTLIMVADLHAMTTAVNIYLNTIQTTKLLIACGVDPSKCSIFQQSLVPAHSQLYWVLSNHCPVGELERMTQWKTKTTSNLRHSGLLTYPILQAADILLYRPNLVPIGEDQVQHLELCRSLARKLNREIRKSSAKFENLIIPRPVLSSACRVKSLRNPDLKMSKSDSNQNSCILLTDSNNLISSKINRAITDNITTLENIENRPGMLNLFQIIAGCKGIPIADAIEGLTYAQGPNLHKIVKKEATEVLCNTVEPIAKRLKELNDGEVVEVLKKGSIKANSIANNTLHQIMQGLKVW